MRDPTQGFLEFLGLETQAAMKISDSGIVIGECAILGTPCLKSRQNIERIDLIELGIKDLSEIDINQVFSTVNKIILH